MPSKHEKRPLFENIDSGAEFNRWYWLKEELVEICQRCNLPYTGRKFDLRDRIMYALDNDGNLAPVKKRKGPASKFNWAKSKLTRSTIITDNVSFGPNFRGFMKEEIGKKFSCTGEFMEWVKSNVGKNLGDAIELWEQLEKRKEDPNFKREIADNNMYSQYTRDFLEDNTGMTMKEASAYWLKKKEMPTEDGFIRYEKSDLKLK